jgi:HYDIN/CFA65/VesB-like, Ig-like domain
VTGKARRWGMIGTSLLLAAILALVILRWEPQAGGSTASTGAPRLEVDRDTVDLGDVQLGELVEASFVLSNTGDGELVISGEPYVQVVEGCCPPVPALGAKTLDPAQQTTLSIAFVMAGDMGGPHDFRIHFETNDPSWEGRTLTVLSNWVELSNGKRQEKPSGR